MKYSSDIGLKGTFIKFVKIGSLLAKHQVYASIIKAIKKKKLLEPFAVEDFRKACPGFSDLTYKAFLHNHTKGNSWGHSELFVKVNPGQFRIIKPIKYNL